MSCDVGKVAESLENEQSSPSELSEELVTQQKRKKGWEMNCDVGEARQGLENEVRRGIAFLLQAIKNSQNFVKLLATIFGGKK